MTTSPETDLNPKAHFEGTFRVAGLMSGTSLDGLDVAICKFSGDGSWALEAFETIDFPPELRAALEALPQGGTADWFGVGRTFALFAADAVRKVFDGRLDLVVSSGQTIHHQPHAGWTAQVDSPAHLHAALGGIPVVADLRALDVALGGQGAPLVPLADRDLFPAQEACLNLGGFANLSYTGSKGDRIAYDIGPCNLLINHLTRQHLGLPLDRDGAIARSGEVNAPLLKALLALPFHAAEPPKSLGREWLETEVLPLFAGSPLPPADLLATATEYVATTVVQALVGRSALATGGGAWNAFLMERIAASGVPIERPEDERLIDAKEAVAFGWLGLLRALNLPNTLPSATGARIASSSGALWGRFPR